MLQQLPQICSQARGFPTTMPYLDKPNTYIIAIFFRAKNHQNDWMLIRICIALRFLCITHPFRNQETLLAHTYMQTVDPYIIALLVEAIARA